MMKRHQYANDLTLPFVCASLSTDLQKKKAKKAKKRALDAKELADAVTERQRAEQMPEGPDQGVALKAAQDREERAREAVAVHGKSSKKIKVEEPAPATEAASVPTVSIALPGSVIANAQTPELKAYLAGQLARAVAIFRADEVIVYADSPRREIGAEDKYAVFLARILQYLETPQYLRKALFPIHQDLKNVGLTAPTDMPHHLRADDKSRYREGIVLSRPVAAGSQSSWVNVGLQKDAKIDTSLQPGVRVTVEFDERTLDAKTLQGSAVAPSTPREKSGIYWGYQVRLASNLEAVWSESPYGGYDYSLGTSQHGHDVIADREWQMPDFKHMLVVFGGLGGMEEVVETDDSLGISPAEVGGLFDSYVNVCPDQGSRTIRTEEAVLVGMSVLQQHVKRVQGPHEVGAKKIAYNSYNKRKED